MAREVSEEEAGLMVSEVDSASTDDDQEEVEDVSDQDEQEIKEDRRVKACELLIDLLCLHKQVFEADSEDAAQADLGSLGEKYQLPAPSRSKWSRKPSCASLSSQDGDGFCEELLSSEPFGKHLRLLTEHSFARGLAGSAPAPCGLWKDRTSHFYFGSPIKIQETTWRPTAPEVSLRSRFSRDGQILVEKCADQTERRFRIKRVTEQKELVIQVDSHETVLTAYYPWDRWIHFDVLDCVWKNLDVGSIGQIMVDAGPRVNQFVRCLAVRIPPDLAGPLLLPELRHQDEVDVVSGELVKLEGNSDFKALVPAFAQVRKRKLFTPAELGTWTRPLRMAMHQLVQSFPKKTPVNIYYSGLGQLFDLGMEKPRLRTDDVEFLLFLETPPDESQVFTTPMGLAAANNAWSVSESLFWQQRAMDFLFQDVCSYVLAPVTTSIRSKTPYWPSGELVLFAAVLMLRNAVLFAVEVFFFIGVSIRSVRKGTATPMPFNSFSVVRFLIEVYSVFWGFRIFKDYILVDWYHEKVSKASLGKHPMGLAFLIFVKFIQLMVLILNFKTFRKSLLPTWYTIMSRESCLFVMYLLVVTVGCALAYMALPYDTTPDAAQHLMNPLVIFRPFFRMFRLNIMSDFNIGELMGDDTILNISNPNCTAGHWDPTQCYFTQETQSNTTEKLSGLLKMWIIILALMFPVVFLNVYIGLVSEVYGKKKEALGQISHGFVAASVHRELALNYVWNRVCRGACALQCCRRRNEQKPGSGVFIRIPVWMVGDPPDVLGGS